ncbi:uncharacterized protein [Amphiura filiformis]|uniref:uncharacterized protein n=1 Tax=Amphiura filiformis TaxID=82378 RepID=UPI003B21AB90
MELYHIFLVIAMVCRVQSSLHRNYRSETDEQQCEATCEQCFANRQDSLKRMGCLEKCITEGVDQFSCPGNQSFLSAVTPPSGALEREIEDVYVMYTNLFSAKDVESIAATMTEDTMIIIDNQMPVLGRANRAQKIRDFFDANPQVDRKYFDPVEFGEEFGIIWVNGLIMDYDNQNELLATFRFMAVLKRINGELREFIIVLF